MRDAYGSINNAKVIVDFGDRAYGRTRRAGGGFLLDSNAGRKAFNGVDVGALHLVEKLPCVGGKRFDVAALAFGINGIEGQGRFAGARKAGNYGERIAGDFET